MYAHFIFPGVKVEPCQIKPHTVWLKGRPEVVQDAYHQGVSSLQQAACCGCEVVEDHLEQGLRVLAIRLKPVTD